MLIRALI